MKTFANTNPRLGGVAPIPWRLPHVERPVVGQRITPELAANAGEAAIVGAQPLSKNAYKLSLTKALARRTRLVLAAHRGKPSSLTAVQALNRRDPLLRGINQRIRSSDQRAGTNF